MNETLQTALRKLRLSGLAQSLDVRLQEAAGHSLNHVEFLELILQDELIVRAERLIQRRLKAAAFRKMGEEGVTPTLLTFIARSGKDDGARSPSRDARGTIRKKGFLRDARACEKGFSHEHFAGPSRTSTRPCTGPWTGDRLTVGASSVWRRRSC